MPKDSPARFIAPTVLAMIVTVVTIAGSHRLGVANMVIIGGSVHMAEEQITNFPGSLGSVFQIPSTFNLLTHAMLLMGGINALAILAAVGSVRGTFLSDSLPARWPGFTWSGRAW